MKKYLLSIITAVALLLLAVPGAALADETDLPNTSYTSLPPHQHLACGLTDCPGHDDGTSHNDTITYIPVSSEADFVDQTIDNGRLDISGNYYLVNDITLSQELWISSNTNICLNGFTITGKAGANAPILLTGGTTNISDCSADKKGKITSTADSNGSRAGAIYVQNADLNLYGITISDNKSGWAAVSLFSSGNINMHGGAITNNKATYSGGVYISNGTFNLYDGKISANSNENFAGGVCLYDTSGSNIAPAFNMYGGSIDSNEVTGSASNLAGGVMILDGTFTLYDGTIANNIGNSGGGINIQNGDGTFKIEGGYITNNLAKTTSGGGGIYCTGNLYLSGGEITGNRSIGVGGGIAACPGYNPDYYSPSIFVSGNTIVKDNIRIENIDDTTGEANNVFVMADTYLTITETLGDSFTMGINKPFPSYTGTFTSGWATYMAGQSPINYFSSDVDGYVVDLDAAGEAQIRVAVSSDIDQAAATNGSYTVQVDGADVTAPVTENKTVTITATPDKGYQVDTVTVAKTDDPATVVTLSGSGNTRTFTMPDYAVTVTVTFAKAASTPTTTGTTTYRPDIDASEGGSVTVSPSRPEYGDKVTIKTQPEDGYQVAKVTVTDKDGDRINVTDNGDGTYSFIQPRGSVTIEVSFREALCDGGRDCPCYQFSDVDTALWYHQALDYVVANGLMNGTGSATFAPYTELSRGMLVTILWRMEEQPVVNYAMTFEDVAADAYYAEAIRWAAANEVVTGHSSSVFGPDEAITREQMAAILYRYAQYQGMEAITLEENLGGFADSGSISAYAVTAMNWAVGQGVINGNGSNMLAPTGTATRAEAAQMLMNYQQNIAPTLAD